MLNICEKWLKKQKDKYKSIKLDVRSAYVNPEALRYSADFCKHFVAFSIFKMVSMISL